MLQMILIIIMALNSVTLMAMTVWFCCKVSSMMSHQIDELNNELDLDTERIDKYGRENKNRE